MNILERGHKESKDPQHLDQDNHGQQPSEGVHHQEPKRHARLCGKSFYFAKLKVSH